MHDPELPKVSRFYISTSSSSAASLCIPTSSSLARHTLLYLITIDQQKCVPKCHQIYWFVTVSDVDTTDGSNSNKILSDEVTFRVRRSLFGRHGWIVMSTDDSHDLKLLNDVIMHKLSDKIRDMEFSGKDVPNEITIKIKE